MKYEEKYNRVVKCVLSRKLLPHKKEHNKKMWSGGERWKLIRKKVSDRRNNNRLRVRGWVDPIRTTGQKTWHSLSCLLCGIPLYGIQRHKAPQRKKEGRIQYKHEGIYIVPCTEYTQSGNGHFLAYSPSWWKNQPSLLRAGGGACPPPFTICTNTYKVVVYVPAERADILPLYLFYPKLGTLWSRV
jgi:hypothetical protein